MQISLLFHPRSELRVVPKCRLEVSVTTRGYMERRIGHVPASRGNVGSVDLS